MKRCIICKKIIEFGEKHFTGFQPIFPPKDDLTHTLTEFFHMQGMEYPEISEIVCKEKIYTDCSDYELLNVMDSGLALWRGDHETFRLMEEARSARYTAKIQKVVSAVCLADVDIACGELKNAKTDLEYAIQESGTLYVVEDARHMLAELTQKEQG